MPVATPIAENIPAVEPVKEAMVKPLPVPPAPEPISAAKADDQGDTGVTKVSVKPKTPLSGLMKIS
jgi:hypothetical protein